MTVFEELALIYDQSIDWNLRLERELPFLSKLIKDKKPARILDLACGSGRHAVAFALEGHDVIGIDLSSSMIKVANTYAKEKGATVQFYLADIRNAEAIVEGSFDLIISLGNSLALLPSLNELKTTIQSVYSLLKKQGFLVTQTLNFEEIRQSKFRFFPLKSGTTSAGNEVIFARFFEPLSNVNTATLIFTGFMKTRNAWNTHTQEQQVLQLSKPILEQILQAIGFIHINFYADYVKTRFSAKTSRNLIVLAQK